MSQDTRKDPRAKVLTMTVRYKSATLDEFIEHHSHDVSRGGMFIKTPSPFPPGTLLKFEVKIAEDKKVMQGVGRVVWKRESTDNDAERPSGMGVKFIKIDDESTKVIDTLVKGRGEGGAAFEAGEAEGGAAAKPSAAPSAAPAAKPAAAAPSAAPVAAAKAAAAEGPKRKSTMIGLGAVAASQSTAPAKPSEPAPAAKDEPSFFPKTDSEKDMPPPEDRTVMKQAAELLKDALREAGGSMDEVGEAPAPEPKPSEKPAAKAPSEPPAAAKSEAPAAAAPEEKKPSVRPEPEPPPESRVEKKESVKPVASVRPAPAVVPEAQASGGGAGKAVALLVAVAVIAGAVFMFTREKAPETPVTPPPQPTTAATPEKTAEPKPEPTPAETATAAPTEEPAASAKPEPSAAPPEKTAAPPPAPKPPPVVAPKPPPPANTSDNPY